MYFDSFAEFLLMGKHGFYVWTAYGTTAAVLLGSWLAHDSRSSTQGNRSPGRSNWRIGLGR